MHLRWVKDCPTDCFLSAWSVNKDLPQARRASKAGKLALVRQRYCEDNLARRPCAKFLEQICMRPADEKDDFQGFVP